MISLPLPRNLASMLFNSAPLRSLRRQFTFVLALLAILVAAYGAIAMVALNQSRTATLKLAELQLGRVQTSHDLVWQILSASDLSNRLALTSSSEEAELRYTELIAQLRKIDNLVDKLSGGDNDLNVLDLQYSDQLFSATAGAVVQQRGMQAAAHQRFEEAYRQSYAAFSKRPGNANQNARLILELLQTANNASTARQLRTSLGNLPGVDLPWADDAGDPFALRLAELERQSTIDLLRHALRQHVLGILASAREQSDHSAGQYRQTILDLAQTIKHRQQWVMAMLSVSLLLLWLIAHRFVGRHVLGRMQIVSRYLRFDRPHVNHPANRQVPVTGSDEIAAMARALERLLEDREQLQVARKFLEENQSRLAIIIEHAADGFVVMQQGVIRQLNPAAESLLGWQAGETPRLDLGDPSDHLGAVRIDTLAHTAAGRAVPVEVSISDVTLPSGPSTILVIRDATLRHEAERQLGYARDAAQAARSAHAGFLSNIGHEFRAPLDAIMKQARVLEHDPQLSGAGRYCIGIVERNGQLLLKLTNDILDLAQIEANRLELRVCQFDLAALLDSVADNITLECVPKGLAFQRDWSPDLPAIHGDEKRLRQILLNLLDNALKFTQDGRIQLRVEWQTISGEESGVLRFEVEDSGIGIAPENLERLLMPNGHERRDANRSLDADSNTADVADTLPPPPLSPYPCETGLGLAICSSMLTLMGSRLQIRSRVGEGSVFWFDLPVVYETANEENIIK